MLQQGLTLLVAGMGGVFLFLAVMVLVMQFTGAFFRRFAHLFASESESESHIQRLAPDESAEIAVIVAAITAYNR